MAEELTIEDLPRIEINLKDGSVLTFSKRQIEDASNGTPLRLEGSAEWIITNFLADVDRGDLREVKIWETPEDYSGDFDPDEELLSIFGSLGELIKDSRNLTAQMYQDIPGMH